LTAGINYYVRRQVVEKREISPSIWKKPVYDMQFPCVYVFDVDIRLLWGKRGNIRPLSKLSILASKFYFPSNV
jgi:hypothetical protein